MIWELMSTFDIFSAWNFTVIFFVVYLQQKLSDFGGEFGGWQEPRRIQLLDILRFHGFRGEVQNISPRNSEPCTAFTRIALLILLQIKGEHLSHEKKTILLSIILVGY